MAAVEIQASVEGRKQNSLVVRRKPTFLLRPANRLSPGLWHWGGVGPMTSWMRAYHRGFAFSSAAEHITAAFVWQRGFVVSS